ncbi:DUF6279 family lipoprotein [Schlegelella sp. S2-27]|uniref:DUF6279 family lipoprotein n=1 Tax=Caldimonas mangrovi TaxID=2944811 RepID=A0ABT0YKT4_9BURK|nr:DUF6279 family lipoprotein [Caldimonas mangrovi]
MAPLLAVLAAALLAGCSTLRLAYEQGPRLAYWWLDPYVDFNDAQKQQARHDLAQWFEWHRRTQLPLYAQALSRAQRDAAQDGHAAQACRWWDEVQQWRDGAFEQVLPKAAELALTLTPAQIDHLQQHYAKTNRKFRDEFLQADPDVRRREALKRTAERAERFYGRLDDTQRHWVAQKLAASPFDPQLWLQERQRRQQDIVHTLRSLQQQRATPEQAREAIRDVYRRTVSSPNEAYRSYAQALTAYNCEFVAQLHNRTSAEQRRTAVERLRGWESDLRALAETDARVGGTPRKGDQLSALER